MGCGASKEEELNTAGYDEGVKITDANVMELFKIWDFDGSGKLSVSEMVPMLGQVDAEAVMKQNDTLETDGELDPEEFLRYIHKNCPFIFTDPLGKSFESLKQMISDKRAEYDKAKA